MADLTKITDENFNAEVIDSANPVLVDFWADWCRPCHMIEPHVKAIAEEYAGKLKVTKLNIDENPRTAQRYGVMSIPTLLLFIDGAEKERIVGTYPRDRIVGQIKQYLN
ncbi:MAG: thioredoxin [Actinomycetota bacterium]